MEPDPLMTNANTLVVVGIGTATMTADVAELTVSLQATAESPGAALGQVTDASQRVVSTAAEQGIARTDLRTQSVAVRPEYDHRSQRIRGYTAEHSLSLRLPEIATAPHVIDAVTRAAGETLRMGGFSLFTPDTADVRSEAAVNAVEDARTRAQLLAEAAGAHLGPVVSVSENIVRRPQRGGFEQAVGHAEALSMKAGLPVQAGSAEVTATVTVSFQLLSS